MRVEAFQMHARGPGAAALLKDVRENPAVLITDSKKDLRGFRVALTTGTGSKRGRGKGGFIDSVVDALNGFYGDVIQHLKAWTATPPKLRESDTTPTDVSSALVSTSLSSQDGAEPAEEPDRPPSLPERTHVVLDPATSEAHPEPALP